MLVLSRQRDETIMIGDNIEITVVDIRGDKVRLGINAPRQVQVHRKEVYEAIQRENTDALQIKLTDLNVANDNLRWKHNKGLLKSVELNVVVDGRCLTAETAVERRPANHGI